MGKALQKRIKQEQFESPLHEVLLNVMVAGFHVRESFERVCQQYGLSQGQYNVLRILKGAHPNGYARYEILDRMLERAPDVTRLIDKLVYLKLVKRSRSTEDRRVSLASITKKGLERLEEMKPSISAVQDSFGARLNREQQRQLSTLCELLYG